VYVIGETHLTVGQQVHPYPIDINYRTEAPVWIRRDDLDLSVQTHGLIHYDPAGVTLTGSIDQGLHQSWIDILGKRFRFDRVSLEFNGELVLNPVLDVAAHYDGPTIGRIGVTVTGRYLAPDIQFSSEQFPSSTQGEILALLVLGRRESRGAGDEQTLAQEGETAAISILTGILANFGTTYARGQFGALRMPFLIQPIIEPGSGNNIGQYGGGVTIPSVPRLYLEGVWGTVQSYAGATSTDPSAQRPQDFHALAEYTISEHWSVSGNFGTSGRAGADLYYNYSP
jgi:hypothetical protein